MADTARDTAQSGANGLVEQFGHSHYDSKTLYAGANYVFKSTTRGDTWERISPDLPTCAVHDIAVHPRDGDLVIGTHGRSAFVMDVKGIKKIKEALAK